MSRVPVKTGAYQNGGSSVQWSQFQPPKHTAIPLREQCRVRRFFFFYHDIRAFTTSVRARRESLGISLRWGVAAVGASVALVRVCSVSVLVYVYYGACGQDTCKCACKQIYTPITNDKGFVCI